MIAAFLILIIVTSLVIYFIEKMMASLSPYYKSSVLLLLFGLLLFIFYDYYIGQEIDKMLLNGVNTINESVYQLLNNSRRVIIFFIFFSSIICFVSSFIEVKSEGVTSENKNFLYITAITGVSIFIFCCFFIVTGMGWTM